MVEQKMVNSVNETLIIAEAGVNHNGNIDMALKLIDAAADAGADLVKFQTFCADRLAVEGAKKADYQALQTGSSETQYEMLKRLQLSGADHEVLIRHCERSGIGFFSTGFDIESLDLLAGLGQRIFKIPSGEITNLPYLRHVAALKGDVILSTGMATLGDIEAALVALEQAGCSRKKITVLHCTTEYPAPFSEVNLRAMNAIGTAFGVRVGYSDHTVGIEVAIASVALGATIVEKHFTLDRSLPGPDHAASLEPIELKSMICSIRNIEAAMGSCIKQRTKSEDRNVLVARKSIVAARDIAEGEVFSEENLTTKRPGLGMSPMLWDTVVGSVSRRDYHKDELIQP